VVRPNTAAAGPVRFGVSVRRTPRAWRCNTNATLPPHGFGGKHNMLHIPQLFASRSEPKRERARDQKRLGGTGIQPAAAAAPLSHFHL